VVGRVVSGVAEDEQGYERVMVEQWRREGDDDRAKLKMALEVRANVGRTQKIASVLRLVLAKPLRVSTAYYVRSGG